MELKFPSMDTFNQAFSITHWKLTYMETVQSCNSKDLNTPITDNQGQTTITVKLKMKTRSKQSRDYHSVPIILKSDFQPHLSYNGLTSQVFSQTKTPITFQDFWDCHINNNITMITIVCDLCFLVVYNG